MTEKQKINYFDMRIYLDSYDAMGKKLDNVYIILEADVIQYAEFCRRMQDDKRFIILSSDIGWGHHEDEEVIMEYINKEKIRNVLVSRREEER